MLNELGYTKPIDLGVVNKLAVTPLNAGEKDKKKKQLLAILNDTEDVIVAKWGPNLESIEAKRYKVEDDSDETPEGITWCAADTVVLTYRTRLVLVGKDATAVFDLTDSKFDIRDFKGYCTYNEVDGLRVLTNDNVYFLERVVDTVNKAFDVVSIEASAQILSAYQKYLVGDPGAEEVLKGVKEDANSNLSNGIKDLITAATYEFEPEHQKYLLKAASFAKNFISPGEFNAEEFVRTLKDLRIVNQLHVPKVSLAFIRSTGD